MNKRFECPDCFRTFGTSSDLTRHRRVHTGEKPYKCERCPRSFTQKNALNIHMNQHLGLKPFSCKYCPNAFSDPSSKRRHERETHEEIHIYCPVDGCDHKNKRRTGLISHMQSVHKITDPAVMLAAREVVEINPETPPSTPPAQPFAQFKEEQLTPPQEEHHAPVPITPPELLPMPMDIVQSPPHFATRLPSATDTMMREFLVPSVFESPRASQAMPGPVPQHFPAAMTLPSYSPAPAMHFHDPWNSNYLLPPNAQTPYGSPIATPHSVSPSPLPSRIPSPAAPLLSLSDLSMSMSPLFTNTMLPSTSEYDSYDSSFDLFAQAAALPPYPHFMPFAQF